MTFRLRVSCAASYTHNFLVGLQFWEKSYFLYLLLGLFILQCLTFLFLLQMSAGNPPSMKIDVNRRLQESATAGNFFGFFKIKLVIFCKRDSGYLSHATEEVTGYSFWDRFHNFLHRFTWIVLALHKLNKLGKLWTIAEYHVKLWLIWKKFMTI